MISITFVMHFNSPLTSLFIIVIIYLDLTVYNTFHLCFQLGWLFFYFCLKNAFQFSIQFIDIKVFSFYLSGIAFILPLFLKAIFFVCIEVQVGASNLNLHVSAVSIVSNISFYCWSYFLISLLIFYESRDCTQKILESLYNNFLSPEKIYTILLQAAKVGQITSIQCHSCLEVSLQFL